LLQGPGVVTKVAPWPMGVFQTYKLQRADGAILGQVSRVVFPNERSSKIAMVTSFHELGFFLGPIGINFRDKNSSGRK